MMTRNVLFLLAFLCAPFAQLGAQKAPAWLHTLPEPKGEWVFGVGISDKGLEPEKALLQAERRALVLAALSVSTEISTTRISSVAAADQSGLDIDPRNSFSVELEAASCAGATAEPAGKFVAEDVVFVLLKAKKSECGKTGAGIRVRMLRDDAAGAVNVALSIEAPADSVFLFADEQGGVLEYRAGWPEVEERIRPEIERESLRSKTPGWLNKPPKKKTDAAFSIDVAAHKGRFAPFLSFVQGVVQASADINEKLGPEYILEEDAFTVGNQTVFATTERFSRHRFEQLRPERMQVSRAGVVYQTYVRISGQVSR
jgi:hypothetical protein